MKNKKRLIASSILVLFLLTPPTSANTDVEIDSCVCEGDRIVVVEDVNEQEYNDIAKLENDLICIKFESMRVDKKYSLDLAICERDAST